MIYSLKPGEKLPLSFQCFNYSESVFVRAILRDSDWAELPQSPVDLTLGADGKYSNGLIDMPDVPHVTAQYVVYSDSGYTVVDPSQGAGLDLMLNVELNVGDVLPVYCQLFDYNPDCFVKSYITDNDENPIVGSPAVLEAIGTLGLYGTKEVLVPDVAFVNQQARVYDDDTYTTLSSSEGGSMDTLTIGASLFFLEPPGVPNLASVLNNWMVPLTFEIISKSIGENYSVKERAKIVRLQGIWQPFSTQQLKMLSYGQRKWKWFMMHARPTPALDIDDIVKYLTVPYRVVHKNDYTLNGFIEYHLIDDYTGSGPPQ